VKARVMTAVTVVLALFFCVSGFAPATAAQPCNSQRWDLDSDSHPVVEGKKLMEKPTSTTPEGSVPIGPNDVIKWLVAEPAQTDVTFPGGSWFIYLETTDNWGDNCIASIGGWSLETAGWYDIATVTGTSWSFDGGILMVEVQTGSGTIYSGDYLGLKVRSTASESNTVVTNGDSYMLSPCTDPGYPLPEIAAGILLGLGLAGLGGYLGVRRLRTSRSPR